MMSKEQWSTVVLLVCEILGIHVSWILLCRCSSTARNFKFTLAVNRCYIDLNALFSNSVLRYLLPYQYKFIIEYVFSTLHRICRCIFRCVQRIFPWLNHWLISFNRWQIEVDIIKKTLSDSLTTPIFYRLVFITIS